MAIITKVLLAMTLLLGITSTAPIECVARNSAVVASITNTCESTSAACIGDVTHWDGGLGACGWNVNTDADMCVSLPFGFMGTLSNSNPYCGRAVTLFNPITATTMQAKVCDKCMGCANRSIDTTDVLFQAITNNQGDGRMSGIEWWFTDTA